MPHLCALNLSAVGTKCSAAAHGLELVQNLTSFQSERLSLFWVPQITGKREQGEEKGRLSCQSKLGIKFVMNPEVHSQTGLRSDSELLVAHGSGTITLPGFSGPLFSGRPMGNRGSLC